MDFIDDALGPLALVVVFLCNELAFALATGSYGIVYNPMRVVVIPAGSGLLILVSIVGWWKARHGGDGERRARPSWRLTGALVAAGIWAFQWYWSYPLFE